MTSSAEEDKTCSGERDPAGVWVLRIGVLVYVVNLALVASVFVWLPPGTKAIRPMIQATLILGTSVLGWLVGIPLSVVSCARKRWGSRVVGLILALSSLPVSVLLVHVIADVLGIRLAE